MLPMKGRYTTVRKRIRPFERMRSLRQVAGGVLLFPADSFGFALARTVADSASSVVGGGNKPGKARQIAAESEIASPLFAVLRRLVTQQGHFIPNVFLRLIPHLRRSSILYVSHPNPEHEGKKNTSTVMAYYVCITPTAAMAYLVFIEAFSLK